MWLGRKMSQTKNILRKYLIYRLKLRCVQWKFFHYITQYIAKDTESSHAIRLQLRNRFTLRSMKEVATFVQSLKYSSMWPTT